MRIKKVSRFSLYNLLWYVPYRFVQYECVRYGREFFTLVKCGGFTLGLYEKR